MSIFAQTTQGTTSRGGANQLPNTANVNAAAELIAHNVLEVVLNDESMIEDVKQSMVDSNVLDNLITNHGQVSSCIGDWSEEVTENEADKILKSVQSKRCRCKKLVMTEANYKSLVTSAAAEAVIRTVSGKYKNASRIGSNAAALVLTEEAKELYTADQEALRKAIRNVQSKKSIMKARADFSEESLAWQDLCSYEAGLKSLRVAGTTTIIKDERAEQVAAVLNSIEDIDKLKAADAKEALKQVQEMLMTLK